MFFFRKPEPSNEGWVRKFALRPVPVQAFADRTRYVLLDWYEVRHDFKQGCTEYRLPGAAVSFKEQVSVYD